MTNEYREYLKSDHWKCLRKKAVETWGDRCCSCSVPRVDVHHLRYGNLFDVTVEDLLPLCRRCHDAVHSSLALRELLNGSMPSAEKRTVVLSFLAGRDEGLRIRTKEADKGKSSMSFCRKAFGKWAKDVAWEKKWRRGRKRRAKHKSG